jgi:hypothetical protein
MVFKIRDYLGVFSPAFDILTVSLFLLSVFVIRSKSTKDAWLFYGAAIVCFSTLLGPVAFQRYFEPHLLILLLLAGLSEFGAYAKPIRPRFLAWLIFMVTFQVIELSGSALLSI